MGNGRERSKRETFMEEKEQLHYPEWIETIKEEEEDSRKKNELNLEYFPFHL